MSRDAAVAFDWADGEHRFRLGIKELRELQEKCDAGPAFILGRLVDGSWRVDDILQTIRLGLIGGGLTPVTALPLVKLYVEQRPLFESIPAAQAILSAALVGAPDEPLGKAPAATDQPTASPEESSASPPSTAQPA
jgi:hypothetical protein